MTKPRPTLVVLAGPNGAGKSTLYETRIAPSLKAPFINADIIQRDELKNSDVEAAYEAARVAARRRAEFLAQGRGFVTESVFSHPSKLDLIQQGRAAGFRIMLFHICLEHPDLSVARVGERVKEGGHPVPENKIRQRYDRNGPLIRQAALHSDVAHIFDNSRLNQPPERVMSFTGGKLSFVNVRLPKWALRIYSEDLRNA
ncbi:Zeta toxin [Roseovarius albus]|uniref:Zeta toxin n=1 Tax=Roseovarius albus TaxID=1247867 RepID=A0A1X7A490_9RHOB|nr:zeta toxin family protein [Roseovarius albus]SLN70111.1 Zeta toxin [Roseovarius albus]